MDVEGSELVHKSVQLGFIVLVALTGAYGVNTPYFQSSTIRNTVAGDVHGKRLTGRKAHYFRIGVFTPWNDVARVTMVG